MTTNLIKVNLMGLNTLLINLIMMLYLLASKYSAIEIFIKDYLPLSTANMILVNLFFSLYLSVLLFLNRGIHLNRQFSKEVFMLFSFIIVVYLSFNYLSIDPYYSIDKLKQVFILLFFTLVPLIVNFNNSFLYTYFKGVFFINIIYLFLFVFFYKDNLLLSISTGQRLATEEVNAIWLARILGENILITFMILKNKSMKALIILIQLFLVILTGSKGPLLALFFIFLVYTLYRFKRKKRYSYKNVIFIFLKGIFFFSIAIFFIYFILKYLGIDFIYSRLIAEDGYAQYGRMNRYLLSLDYFNDNPLFGIGFGNWGYYFTGFFGRNYPHNIVLEALTELGLIGAIPLFYLFIAGIRKAYIYMSVNAKNSNKAIAIVIILFAYFFFNSLLSGDIGLSNQELFIYLGILLGAINNKVSRGTKI